MIKNLTLACLAVCCVFSALADVRLPNIFGDDMVLQRNRQIPVWGWAAPGERVTVVFNKQTVRTKAGKDGSWKLYLKPETAGGPYQFRVKGKNEIVLQNVLVGEVWVCSGQSNMEMHVKHSADKRYAQEIREANYPQIRHIKVPSTLAEKPASDIPVARWRTATDSAYVADFTSVGYFFARKLQEELGVPIGLINASWGGTIVETWISREALDRSDEFGQSVKKTVEQVKAASKDGKIGPNQYPALLFNGMINPIIPFAIQGAIWYQGESNAQRAYQYQKAFPLMIQDWRTRWQQGDFPFYFVQLASFDANGGNSRKGSTWAELREAQTATLVLNNTGMAVTIDIGDSKDIHPANKKDVGLRLAAIALHQRYEKNTEYSGPVYRAMTVEENKAIVSFTHDEGLWVNDKYGYLKGFEVAGADQRFYYARANVVGNRVEVYSDSVAAPVAVRYAWADDIPEANLYNKAGFPAGPFRTDNWKGVTQEVRYTVE